jgi:predicted ATPase
MNVDELNVFFDIPINTANLLLDEILKNTYDKNKIIISDNVYTDTNINEWIKSKPSTMGGAKLIDKLIKTPINDKKLLLNRQKSNYIIPKYQLEILKNTETELLWIMTLKKEIDEDMAINLLYPSTVIINNINYSSYILNTYHFYKIAIIPFLCLFYPISIIYSPYYYLNNYLKLEITFMKYIGFIYQAFKLLFQLSGNIKADISKIITIFAYIAIYIYSTYQSFYMSYIIYKTRERLLNKLNGLIEFIKTSITVIKQTKDIWKPYFLYLIPEIDINTSIERLSKLNNDVSTIYKLWKCDNYKDDIITLLKIIYTIDIIDCITKLKYTNSWSLPTYDNTNTKLWNVNNPLLPSNQVSNPVNLSKNIIITGVNAGGKTTYVKSITINIILAQTLGIIYAIKGNVYLYDAITSFMRVSDEIGSKSYFEAETEYCNNMINVADDLSKKNKRGLFLMDEPMHSTPPIEGIAVAFSVAEYLANIKGMTLIITTHFHNLIELEDKYKYLFINLNVNASFNENTKTYDFNYKINRGGSKQIIAIELLEKKKFNKNIINSAIEMKNKLYTLNLRNAII